MKTVFITGGASTIGHAVAQRLARDCRLLFLLHQRTIELPGIKYEIIRGDLLDISKHTAQIANADVVLHVAGLTHAHHPQDYMRTNLDGTCALLNACKPDQPVVFLSTRTAHLEGGAYSHSKLLAEEAVRNDGRPFTIIRSAEVYGSKAGEGIDRLLELARRYRVLIDFRWKPKVTYSPISVAEVADFIADVVNKRPDSYKTYTLCNNQEYTVPMMATARRQAGKRPWLRIPVSVHLLQRLQAMHVPMPFKPDQLTRLVLPKSGFNHLARQDYGFDPVCFLDAIRSI